MMPGFQQRRVLAQGNGKPEKLRLFRGGIMENRNPNDAENPMGGAQPGTPKNTKLFQAPSLKKQGMLKVGRNSKKFAPPVIREEPVENRTVNFDRFGEYGETQPAAEPPKAEEKKKKGPLMAIIFAAIGVILLAAIGLILYFVISGGGEEPTEETPKPSETVSDVQNDPTPKASETQPAVQNSPEAKEKGLPKLGGKEVTSDEMVKKGDILTFGVYEQDANVDNGREPLTWRVLKKDNRKLLLITEKVIDVKAFDSTRNANRWADSEIRRWLNDSFMDKAFTAQEKMWILETEHEDRGNDRAGVLGGPSTWDRVFLLDIAESYNLFDSDEDRQGNATEYAKQQGVRINYGHCWWWLRSPGKQLSLASAISYGGSQFLAGEGFNKDDIGVRPAIWIEIPIE